MAITEKKLPVSWHREFYGLSTDVKPVGVAIGSEFTETDTGLLWVTYDGTLWIKSPMQKILPERFDFILHPFGKGSLTTDGVQYSAEVAGIGDTYTAIEVATINQPVGYALQEIEFGLTVAIKSSAAAEGVNWKMQASDAGVLWQDLIAERLRAASCAAYLDMTALGRFAPTGNFLGTGATFQVRAVVKSAVVGGETATGKMKNSSYVILKYRRS